DGGVPLGGELLGVGADVDAQPPRTAPAPVAPVRRHPLPSRPVPWIVPRVVLDAVRRMRLTPVMFELGARPYPPRELYRAYLAQSDVFIGLYWQSYGW